jgi:hypothetical protein
LAVSSVGSTNIQAGAVGATQIATSAVGTTQLASGAVTATQIASNAVTPTKMSVGGPQWADGVSGSNIWSGGGVGAGNGFFYGGTSSGTTSVALLSTSWAINIGSGNTVISQVSNGDLTITGSNAYKPGGGTWTSSSDSRIKKDVANYTKSMSDILALRPVTYKFNGQYGTANNGVVYSGFIAQELETTSFSSMVGSYQYKDPSTGAVTSIKTVDVSELVYALVNAVKELNNRIIALEQK